MNTKTKLEKLGNKMTEIQYEHQTKISKKERQIKELQQRIRVEESLKQEKTIYEIQKSGMSINQSIHLRTTKSQLELNGKTSETVLYGNYDETADDTILESLNKRHKRRPSSLSSAERVVRSKLCDYNMKYDYPNNIDESYLSQNYMAEGQGNEFEGYQLDKEEGEFDGEKEIREISMSYLEEDYEEAAPRTQRDGRNTSRPHQKENSYKRSPISKNTSSAQNFKSHQKYDDISPNRVGKVMKSRSIKKIPLQKPERMTDTPNETMHTKYNYAEDYTEDYQTKHQQNLKDQKYYNNREISNYDQEFSTNEKKVNYSKVKRDNILNMIDSQCHNTFDNRENEEGTFGHRHKKDFAIADLNHTVGDSNIIQPHLNPSQDRSKRNLNTRGDEYRSKERTPEYEKYEIYNDNPERSYSPINITSYSTHNNKLRKHKSKNSFKPDFEKCQKLKTSEYTDENMYTTHKSFREYQPKQKGRQDYRQGRGDGNEYNKTQTSPSRPDGYYDQLESDKDYLLHEELPSKTIEK